LSEIGATLARLSWYDANLRVTAFHWREDRGDLMWIRVAAAKRVAVPGNGPLTAGFEEGRKRGEEVLFPGAPR
jgi:hypothetical protein